MIKSSGNLYKDFNYPNPDEMVYKAQLAIKIIDTIQRKKISQAQAARLLNVDPAKVSAIKRGQLSGFSTDRLIRFLNTLGQDVEIVIKSKSSSRQNGEVRVLMV